MADLCIGLASIARSIAPGLSISVSGSEGFMVVHTDTDQDFLAMSARLGCHEMRRGADSISADRNEHGLRITVMGPLPSRAT